MSTDRAEAAGWLPNVVGLLIDVSASMKSSIRNDTGRVVDRLDGWTEALRTAAARASSATVDTTATDQRRPPMRIFAYAFGLTAAAGEVCDLFSLLRLVDEQESPEAASVVHSPEEPGAGENPYDQLDRLALRHGKAGWRTWIRRNLSPHEAAMLLANLRESPALLQGLTRTLPNMSEEQFRLAEARDRGELRIRGAADAWNGLWLVVKANDDGFQSRLAEAEQIVRTMSSRRVTFAEVVADRLTRVGPTTLTPGELATLLEKRVNAGLGSSGVDEILYGNTPLCLALEQATARFAREQADRASPDISWSDLRQSWRAFRRSGPDEQGQAGARFVSLVARELGKLADMAKNDARPPATLFVVSDGEPTDGDPADRFASLRDAGVTIVSCFVTAQDMTEDPRVIPAKPDPSWSAGARTMFSAASPIPQGLFLDHLRERGWRIPADGRLFFQVNHSSLLAEIAEMLFEQ
ncbi:hypothetical protein CS0771_33540 [Catellatospora sp. IY07-71]|uniref:hypothetical protein n=1 Tax=Catellatospora sp. IY07-71 TaxID=2728827 RepID=UPI001BB45FC2|nr:hypothetical protein [Catellatospora sp. IY07-71]BCJ73810.1 hypothetical protein CS0771_33540 [Catellatospora sp. IY07-71]